LLLSILVFYSSSFHHRSLLSFPTRRSSDLVDFAYFDQLTTPTESEIDYDLKGKLAIPETELENFSGGELTRLKLARIFKFCFRKDRKSTRLNSSHVSISYAVFCLKKKKK